MLEFAIEGQISGVTVYSTKEEAIAKAKEIGCDSYHEHELNGKTVYMPCEKHTEATDSVLESFAATDEKQEILSPLMVPNKLIKRVDDEGEEYFVYFTKETIKKLAHKAMKDEVIHRVNIEHDGNLIDDIFMTETWLKESDEDKSNNYGYNLPVGTWFAKYKIDNKEIWNDYIKSGKVLGLSVEGVFSQLMLSKVK